jgi:hypothetical protein
MALRIEIFALLAARFLLLAVFSLQTFSGRYEFGLGRYHLEQAGTQLFFIPSFPQFPNLL